MLLSQFSPLGNFKPLFCMRTVETSIAGSYLTSGPSSTTGAADATVVVAAGAVAEAAESFGASEAASFSPSLLHADIVKVTDITATSPHNLHLLSFMLVPPFFYLLPFLLWRNANRFNILRF